eukprot:CAMPEP_0181394168 /NCGR_PEP_ID=MMETSP1106-20121128/27636_1 /TAXON_ID=81844 /ORGANISM="Mantoniella antarctica, Strain SL-175" /LENGTH=60 /DNA_ID=CAMNT_0023515651 /DNA_START=161 /DNA_END=343 /DNA_ORIENTATION=-
MKIHELLPPVGTPSVCVLASIVAPSWAAPAGRLADPPSGPPGKDDDGPGPGPSLYLSLSA